MKLPEDMEIARGDRDTSLYTSPPNPTGWKGFQREGF